MSKRFGLLFIAVFVLAALFMTSCAEPSSSPSAKKLEINVKIADGLRYVVRGDELELSAVVTASDGKPGKVTWDVSGNNDLGTKVIPVAGDDYKGKLIVPITETSNSLDVIVTSDRLKTKSDFVTITVGDNTQPSVTGVRILLNGINVDYAVTQESISYYVGDDPIQFTHLILGDDGVSQDVNWNVEGHVSCGDPDCENGAVVNDGLLTICGHEVVREIDVTVTSAIDTSKSASAKVQIGIKDKVFGIKLFLDDGSEVLEDTDNIEVLKGDTYTFTYDITAVDGYKDVDWVIDGESCNVQSCEGTNIKDGAIPFSVVLTVCEHETAEEITVTVKSMIDPAFFKSVGVTILSPPTVHSVTIKLPKDGSNNDINKFYRGGNYQFTLDIDADAGANEAVVWGIAGTADGETVNGTVMSHGALSISLPETAKTITITAVSVLNSDARDEKVINISSPISITIAQSGSPFSAPGGSLSFHATVEVVEGIVVSEHITWEVNSAVSQIHGTGPNAALEINASETASTLTVGARSDALSDVVSNTLNVTVVKEVRFAALAGSTWTYQTMNPQSGGAFTYRATVNGETEFRLNIGDGKWFVPVTDGAKQQPNWGEEEMAYFDTATQRSWVLPVLGYYDITVTPHTMKMIVIPPNVEQLDTPAAPAFSEQGVATWLAVNGDEHVTGYTLYLLLDGLRLEDTRVNVNQGAAYTHDFLPVMRARGIGGYTVIVNARGNNFDSRDSEFSAQSVMREVKQRDTITALSWDGDKAKWTAKDSLQLGYKVTLYKDKTHVEEYTTTHLELEKDFTSDIDGKNGSYEFRVIALGADTSLVTDSEESAFSPADLKLYTAWLLTDHDSYALPGSPMAKEGGKFIWNKELTETPFSGLWTTFIFSLSDAHDDLFVPVNQSSIDPVIGTVGNDMNRVFSRTGAAGWRLAAGSYVFTLEKASNEWRLTVDKPVVVSGGTIDFDHTIITRGEDYVFVPKLTGHNVNDAEISWEVLAGVSALPVTSAFGTGANDKNTLYVAAGEANTTLIIVLSAADKDGKKEVNRTGAIIVRDPPQHGNVKINLVIQDLGGGNFTIEAPQNLTMSKSAGGSITLSVSAQPSISDVRWVVSNGTEPTPGNSITLLAANFGVGGYTVRLFAVINGIPWSSNHIAFTVNQ